MRRFLILILLISFKSFGQTLEADRLALVAFYQATGGNSWYDNTGWVVPGNPGDNPCGWYGVSCEGGRVTSLIMEQNDAYGPIPAALGSLTALKHLDLSGAGDEFPQFQGDLPAELGNLTNLEYLDISENMIVGPNIQVIGNLTNLRHLAITPYWSVPASFANLTNLEYLRMAANDYPFPTATNLGTIPSFFGTFTKLKTLILRNGSVTGTIPSNLGNLTDMEVLDLSMNKLTGTIPASFNNLAKLTKLDLSHNDLTGPIPNILGIPVAASVDINSNRFNLAGMIENRSVLDTYAPQQTIPLIITPGIEPVTYIKADYGIVHQPSNGYEIFKDGVEVPANDNYGWHRVSKEQRGNYRIDVRNSLLPDLILSTNTAFVDAPMPVTLVSFEGKSENNQTKLTWTTTSETNNKGFEIERSADARTFEKIGFVDGSGDTEENQFYHFTDLNPIAKGYYRLKQLDHDGKSEYSKIVMVKRSNAVFKIYPNPAQDNLVISGIEGEQDLNIVNDAGRMIMSTKVSASKPVSIRSLKPGLYTVKVGTEAGRLLVAK